MTIARDLSKILDANGDLTIDTSTLFVDSSTNRVGIGTTSPSSDLHIYDSGNNPKFILEGVFSGSPRGASISTSSNNLILDAGDTSFVSAGSSTIQFDINSSEAMRIDGSGILSVGTTDTNVANNAGSGNDGVNIHPDSVRIARTDGDMLLLNRLNSGGDIIKILKDGTAVGSIGAKAGDMYLGTNTCGFRFLDASNIVRPATASDGSANDNAISLGDATSRFKDITLSGNIYLGGTGSANALDDYETGSWTPTFNNFSGTASRADYTKIGDIVHLQMYVTSVSGGSGSEASVTGLPFTCRSQAFSPTILNGGYGSSVIIARVEGGTSIIKFKGTNNNTINGVDIDDSAFFILQVTYKTDA